MEMHLGMRQKSARKQLRFVQLALSSEWNCQVSYQGAYTEYAHNVVACKVPLSQDDLKKTLVNGTEGG